MAYVAIVDDEEQVRRALKRLLVASGLDAETYASGKDFLDAAKARKPDCLLLDLHMPGMTGLEVLREMRRTNTQPPPTVVITAHDEPASREQCIAAGAAAYLCKPLDDRVLLNTISANLRRPATGLR